jgi:hypothetical protein
MPDGENGFREEDEMRMLRNLPGAAIRKYCDICLTISQESLTNMVQNLKNLTVT